MLNHTKIGREEQKSKCYSNRKRDQKANPPKVQVVKRRLSDYKLREATRDEEAGLFQKITFQNHLIPDNQRYENHVTIFWNSVMLKVIVDSIFV
jgi:hypothetical protein